MISHRIIYARCDSRPSYIFLLRKTSVKGRVVTLRPLRGRRSPPYPPSPPIGETRGEPWHRHDFENSHDRLPLASMLDELKAKLEQNKNVTATRSIDALRGGYVLAYTGTCVYVAIRYASLARCGTLFQCYAFSNITTSHGNLKYQVLGKITTQKRCLPYSDFG